MNPQIQTVDLDQRPFIAIWEVTQACDLACVHCRASAQPQRDPAELSTVEGKQLIDQIAAWKVPVFVLTGGDPIKRPDLFELIEHARTAGVHVSLTPSATPLLTRDVVHRLKHAGLARLAVSLDGASAPTHDAFRGMSGSFDRTLNAVQWANDAGLPVQINTTFSRRNIGEIDAIVSLMEQLKITLWSVFFLVPTGRGRLDDLLSADEFDLSLERLHQLSKTATFDIKTTEAQHYRRLVFAEESGGASRGSRERAWERFAGCHRPRASRTERRQGLCIHFPQGGCVSSGFLPLSGGNIRQQKLETIYCESPLFRGLRDASCLRANAASASSRKFAEGRDRAPMRSPATLTRRSRAVRTFPAVTRQSNMPNPSPLACAYSKEREPCRCAPADRTDRIARTAGLLHGAFPDSERREQVGFRNSEGTWKSRELAPSHPLRDRPTGSPAMCASTRCSSARTGAASAPASPSNRARAPHGTRTRSARHSSSPPAAAGAARGRARSRRSGPATLSGFRRAKSTGTGPRPTTGMTHIALQEKHDGKVVDWMEHVSDEQYRK